MIDLEPTSAPSSFDVRHVDAAPDAEVDALPFGVIALDGSGTVLRYNLFESRLARLDRNQVVGRNFFSEIARCTRTETFEGRYKRMLAAASVGASETFDFVFGFAFGEQHVTVEMVLAAPGRVYLFINRRSVKAERTQSPEVPLAVEQRALAPDEGSFGVRRDDQERRHVDVAAPFFAALRATCDRVAPESWQLFATEWGVQWGRRTAIDLEVWALERGRASLRELPMAELAARVEATFGEHGWGRPGFDFRWAHEGLVVLTVERSALAEAAPRVHTRGGDGPPQDLACHLLAGAFSGLMTYVADRRLTAREVECRAAGAERCSFALTAHERRRVIDGVLRRGERGIAPVREALLRAPLSGADSDARPSA